LGKYEFKNERLWYFSELLPQIPCLAAYWAHNLMETIAGGPDGRTAFFHVLLSSFSPQLAVCRITLKMMKMVSRHARGDARHIDRQGLSVNHHERLTHK
jgi:hypothetical protein